MLTQCQPFSTAYLLLLKYIISYNYHKKAIYCKSLSKLAFSDMDCKRVRMLSVNVQAWNKRARVIIDVFLASFLASCPSWHLSKESESPFFSFSQFSLLIAAWWMLRWACRLGDAVIVYHARLCLLCFKKGWFCVANFTLNFFCSFSETTKRQVKQ